MNNPLSKILVDKSRITMIEAPRYPISHYDHPALNDGRITLRGEDLVNPVIQLRSGGYPNEYVRYQREPDAHQIGYRFVFDRNVPTENPASVFKNITPPAEILNNIAQPRPFPKIFGL